MVTLKTFIFNKLIRSKYYHRMIGAGATVKVKDVSREELLKWFKKKMLEEAQEVYDTNTKEDLVEELADCLEVIRGFAEEFDIGMENIMKAAEKKLEDRGGFANSYIVESLTFDIEDPKFKKYVEYFNKNPKRYPVV